MMHRNITRKGEHNYEFITRSDSRGGRVEIRRRNNQHNSYLFAVVLAARIFYELTISEKQRRAKRFALFYF
jgi:hypothetical protein